MKCTFQMQKLSFFQFHDCCSQEINPAISHWPPSWNYRPNREGVIPFIIRPPPPLPWISSGQNFTCRNRTSKMYTIGIDRKYLNPRNLDHFCKNPSIFYQHHLYGLAFVVILPVGIGHQRSTPVGIDGKGGFTMK